MISEKTEALKNELGSLMAQYDELRFHVVPMLKNEYYRQIGNLEIQIENRRIDIACLKQKIEMLKQNKTGEEIEAALRKFSGSKREKVSFDEEYVMTSEKEDGEIIDTYVELLKRLDSVLNANGFESKNRLLREAKQYFMNLDLNGLKMVEYYSRNCNIRENENSIFERYQQLSREVEVYKERINVIKNSFPYNRIDLILDEEKLSVKANELRNCLERLNEEYQSLKSLL